MGQRLTIDASKRSARYSAPMTQKDHRVGADRLPPLAPAEASASERARAVVARMVARHGAPSVEDYRQV